LHAFQGRKKGSSAPLTMEHAVVAQIRGAIDARGS